MSERIRRSHLKHAFEAKHVIVAGCAAVAMVLGAMSVGGAVPSRQPVDTEVSAIATTSPAPAASTAVGGTGMTRQHTLEVRNFLQQQSSPFHTTPAVAPASRSKSITPIFGSSDPVRLINQMVQLQQEQAQPSTDTVSTSTDTTMTDGVDSSKGSTTTPPTASTEDPNATNSNPSTPDEADKSAGESSVMGSSEPVTP